MKGNKIRKIVQSAIVCMLVVQMFLPISSGDIWTETTQMDFQDGTIMGTNLTSNPGDIVLETVSDWWDNNWTYRRAINISENSGNILTDHQVLIEMNTTPMIDAGKMRQDGGDIRFTDSSGEHIPYWVEAIDDIQYDGPADYIARWRFDEGTGTTAYDDSLNNNHGTINGASWTDGIKGKALSFNGTDDYVGTPVVPNFPVGQGFTISAWYKTSVTGSYQGIVQVRNGADDQIYLLFEPTYGLTFQTFDGSKSIHIEDGFGTCDGEWHHVTAVFNETVNMAVLYVDGQEKGFDTFIGDFDLSQQIHPFFIGATNLDGSPTNYFSGDIDEVRIYNRALTDEEIRKVYHEKSRIWVNVPSIPALSNETIYMYYGNPGALDASDYDATFTKDFDETGLVVLWHVDERIGNTANDLSGYGNTGILGGDGLGTDLPEWKEVDGGQWNGIKDARFSTGSCLEFDGVDDYIEIPDSPSLDFTDALTISFWARFHPTSDAYILMAKQKHNVEASWDIRYNWDKTLDFVTSDPSGSLDYLTSRPIFEVDTWYNIVVIYDDTNNSKSMYINGYLGAQKTTTQGLRVTSQPLFIGAWQEDDGSLLYFTDGIIDEVRIYNKILTANEIKTQSQRRMFIQLEPSISYGPEESGYWPLEGEWQYRNPITIDNTANPENLTDYQVMVEVNTTDLISQGKIRPDGGDIRFVDQVGNQIPYWTEVFDNMSHEEPTDYVGKWRLDEGDGNSTVDDSINGNNGTHYGNTKLLMHLDDLAIDATKDESPYTNHGQLGSTSGPDINDPTWNTSGSIAGNHLTFDGLDDYVEIQDKPILDLNFEHTIEVWINTSSIDWLQEDIISKHFYGESTGWRLSVTSDSKIMYTTYPGSGWDSVSTIELNKWYHIAVTFNGFAKSIYINGVLDNQTSVAATNLNDYNVRIGGMHGNNTFNFHGSIDEVAIYSKAFTAEEIASHYNNQYARFIDWASGKYGNAVDFDGTDDYVLVPHDPSLSLTTFTISAWVKWNGPTGDANEIICKEGNGESVSTDNNYGVTIFNDVSLNFEKGDGTNYVLHSPVDFTDYINSWVQVVAVMDEVNMNAYIYLNGDKVSEDLNVPFLPNTQAQPLAIGERYRGGVHSHFFNGTIDEVCIWNRVLTDKEIRAIYNEKSRFWLKIPSIPASSNMTIYMYYGNSNSSTINNFNRIFTKDYEEEGLAGLWHMDEGFGQTLIDSSGNGNHGILINSTSWDIVDGGQWDGRPDVKFHSGSALDFDGVNDYVDIEAPGWTYSQGTIMAWVNFIGGGEYMIFAISDGKSSTDDWLQFYFLGGELKTQIAIGKAELTYPSGIILDDGRWHHIALTQDNNNLSMHIDGIKQFTAGNTIWLDDMVDLTYYRIGNTRHNDVEQLSFPGLIDEVRVYNRSLSAEEIEAIYERRKYTPNEPTVLMDSLELYLSNGTYLSSVYNSSNNGTLWNAINWIETLPAGTDITLATRTGNTSIPDETWSNWSSEVSDNLGSPINSPRARYIQYRATLTTSNNIVTPILSEVIIDYTLNTISMPSLSMPVDNSWLNDNTPTLSWIFSDPNLDAQTYFTLEIDDDPLFGSPDYTSGDMTSSSEFWTPISPLPDGSWFWRVRTMDEYGLWSGWSENWTIIIDTTDPIIILNSPLNNSVVPGGILLDFVITDQNFAYANYSVNGGPNLAFPVPFDISTTGWSDDDYYITVVAYDQAGNGEFQWFHFIIDSTLPAIVLNSPFNNSVVRDGTTLDFSIIDTNIQNVNYSINGGPEVPFMGPYNISSVGWLDGDYTVSISALDEAGNFNSSWYFFTIDSTKPIISLVSPGNNSIITPGTSLDFSIIENNLLQANYSINGGPDNPIIDPYDIDTIGWTDGGYTIVINAEDLAGNVNSSWFFFTISSAPPSFDSGIEDFVTYTGDTFIIYANFTDNTDVTSVTLHYRNEVGSWKNITMTKDTDAGPGGVDRFSISSADLGIMTWNDDSDWHFYFEATDGVLTATHGDVGNYFVIMVIDILGPDADAGSDQTEDEDTMVKVNGSGSWDNIGIANYSWDWDASDGLSLENDTVSATHIYTTPGTYVVTLNVTDAEGNWDTDKLIITVFDITSPFANAGLYQEVNEDSEVTFDGSGSMDNVGINDYYWDFDDSDGIGIDATGDLTTYVFTVPGIYIVSLYVTDEAGNNDIITVTITVLDITAPEADAGQDVTVVEGEQVVFNGSSSDDNNGTAGLTYTWTFDEDGSPVILDGMNPTYTFDIPGIYIVTLYVSDSAGNSDADTIVVIALSDFDEDGIPDIDDPDDDNDGTIDIDDDFPFDSAEDTDTDNDGTGNNADTDDDGDNVSDSEDPFPKDPTEWEDTDDDGTGNNRDTDDDDDGTLDADDDFPLDSAENTDTDNDGTGDNADTDDDGDGTLDSEDEFPLDATDWSDFDGDGTGDNKDLDDDDDGRVDTEDFEPFNREVQDPPADPFPWWLLIIVLIIGLLAGFLLSRMKREEEEGIPEEDAIGAIVEEEEHEPEDYEERAEDEEGSAIIEEEEAKPVEYEEKDEAGEELEDEEGIHEEHLGQDILSVWNEKYESKGYLSTICPSCFEEAEFKVESTETGKDFICPNCKAKYVYQEEWK